ncbi:hypothetical protein A3D03_06620 [Candidatus Gottesmanbacteria bacterium RIFCSPHIGHO2_02_FULL_40_13]|uniref:Nucleotidyl transferase AbiEii/AbiGii toxin family protein n=1 Tax=Candidatus Gottesmanbacteria bacterium RIFCSPHIGHO2_02_FULL_40_13 TaxID=1798384 RepID=A0A1F6A911_9BACT|nr:MAG: hypothetical protein A3D03_06620 [Candidatus Gottesmanbacteria bacterium RIFCSPHIGHO2_02_FULL_40_13]
MKNQYYQDIFTEQSWQILIQLKQKTEFTLIGGWAVYLYSKALKSKDIDLIADYLQLDFLKKEYEVQKNDRLKKYEVKMSGIDIDVYLPFYSNLGIPVEELIKYTAKIDTFTVLRKEMLLLTKLYAYNSRRTTVKGQKDAVDIFALLFLTDFDIGFYKEIVKEFKLNELNKHLKTLFAVTRQVPELDLNPHFFKKKRDRVLEKLS